MAMKTVTLYKNHHPLVCDESEKDKFLARGWSLTDEDTVAVQPEPPPAPEEPSIDKPVEQAPAIPPVDSVESMHDKLFFEMTIDQLLKYADTIGLKFKERNLPKAKIIRIIKDFREQQKK